MNVDFTKGLKKRDSSNFEPKKFENKEEAPAWSRNTLKRSSRPDPAPKKDDGSSRAMPDWSSNLKKSSAPTNLEKTTTPAPVNTVNFRASLKSSSPIQLKEKPAEANNTPGTPVCLRHVSSTF